MYVIGIWLVHLYGCPNSSDLVLAFFYSIHLALLLVVNFVTLLVNYYKIRFPLKFTCFLI